MTAAAATAGLRQRPVHQLAVASSMSRTERL